MDVQLLGRTSKSCGSEPARESNLKDNKNPPGRKALGDFFACEHLALMH